MGMQDRDWYRQELREKRYEEYQRQVIPIPTEDKPVRRQIGSGVWLLLVMVIAIVLTLGFA
ncbi:hypothetical protein PCA10_28900 [Metapseudomonas resinovorans NBRC 106553]|uniref:Uncharacterized protein n=1 Tax=Metapseudomonas resinovorans NBRC 106553 TaxID=1245471 RepID=S6ARP3_METRE|nr:hypothetical protein PCA10_28660 [Pseudomonas resinovorans NBRC 106553]BAN48610.1 hypothetical protein PCA10_28780 [Pseudomonas resinovorans NBRC 106553]BAN48622.1 hypothetical protein PCA10_28900 [Pseudomonas resinovorans NBRC 106553]